MQVTAPLRTAVQLAHATAVGEKRLTAGGKKRTSKSWQPVTVSGGNQLNGADAGATLMVGDCPHATADEIEMVRPPAVTFFQPKYRLGHPENNFNLLSKKSVFRVKVSPKKIDLILKKLHWPPVKLFPTSHCCFGFSDPVSIFSVGTNE